MYGFNRELGDINRLKFPESFGRIDKLWLLKKFIISDIMQTNVREIERKESLEWQKKTLMMRAVSLSWKALRPYVNAPVCISEAYPEGTEPSDI